MDVITNFSGLGNTFAQTCELNQIAMLNELKKMPNKVIFLMALALVALLIILYIVPLLKQSWRHMISSGLITFAIGLLVFAIIMQSAITFYITAQGWLLIEQIVIGLFALWIIIYSVMNWKRIKAFFQKVKLE
jgi:hypothetical protein